jgi:hypothetical protein
MLAASQLLTQVELDFAFAVTQSDAVQNTPMRAQKNYITVAYCIYDSECAEACRLFA